MPAPASPAATSMATLTQARALRPTPKGDGTASPPAQSDPLRMKPRPERRRKVPLSDRAMLWLSCGKRIDGLWVGTYFQTNAGPVMRRLEEALSLIKVHDRRRYDR